MQDHPNTPSAQPLQMLQDSAKASLDDFRAMGTDACLQAMQLQAMAEVGCADIRSLGSQYPKQCAPWSVSALDSSAISWVLLLHRMIEVGSFYSTKDTMQSNKKTKIEFPRHSIWCGRRG